MVTENTDIAGAGPPADSPIDMGTAEPVAEQPVADAPIAPTDDLTAHQPAPDAAPVPDAAPGPNTAVPSPPPAPPAQSQYSPDQIARMQQESAQYAEVQQRAALQNQAQMYQKQLEDQGYAPEHAQQAAGHYMQSQQAQIQMVQQAEAYGKHLQDKQIAAEIFVKQYKLNIEDLEALRVYNDPRSMHAAAEKMSADRARDAELAQLKQARVPAQSFDNSQGNPQVAADEGSWLDRYNSGDRSPNAQAAAKRAAGLG